MTKREALSDVKTGIKKINADAKLFNKEIYIKLSKHLEWLIERDSNTFKIGRKHSIFQTYKCAEVIDVPSIDPCCGIVSNCTIKRTKDKIPDLYEDSTGVLIKTVTSIDGNTEIDYSSKSDFKTKKENPWGPKNKKYWFYENGYIYGDLFKKIKITGLFKEDISKFNKCDSNDDLKCVSFLDEELIAPNGLIAQAIDYVIKDFSIALQIPTQEKIDKNENKP